MAVVLPAPPGSGKSTLCAALTMSGWRLLSDELALLDPDGMWLYPHVRPVSLKNASIALIGGRYPDMQLTEAINDTLKGTVAHMRPPENAVRFATQRATPRWLVFPRYRSGCELTLSSIPKAEALTELASNSFNFSQLGVRAFSALAKLVDDVDCYRFEYSSLDGAIKAFEDLARRTHRPLN